MGWCIPYIRFLVTLAGKKKGGKKASGKAKGGSQPSPAAPKQKGKVEGNDAAHCAALTVNALAAKVLDWQPDMDGAGKRT